MRKIYLFVFCLFFLNPFITFSQGIFGDFGIANCPGNFSITTCNPLGGVVTWTEPTPFNGTILAPLYSFTQTLGPAPGETVLPGFVNIQYTALYGLIPLNGPSETRTCSFTITVGYIAENYFYYDNDGDTYGDPDERIGPFCNDDSWLDYKYVYDNTDCDDNNPAVHESFSFYADNDGDHFGAGSLIPGICAVDANTPPAGYSTNNTDCADNNINIHSPITYYHDGDGDGYGNPSVFTSVCSLTPPANYVANNTDCNDGDITINPATRWVLNADNDGYYTGVIITQCTSPGIGYVIYFEVLNVGCACLVPNKQPGDCDDNNAAVHSTFSFYADNDADLYGAGSLISGICAVDANTPPAGYSTNGIDCNDNAPLLWHLVTFYTDQDHDGYDAGSTSGCAGLIDPFSLYLAGLSLTTNGSDCDDNNALINPATVWYRDADNDNYGDGFTQTQCARGTLYKLASELTSTTGDCDDNNPLLNPATVWYKDADNDNYSNGSTQTQCIRPTGYKLPYELTVTSGDCDDNNAVLNPTTVWYKDADNDSYSSGATLTQCVRPTGYKLASELTATSGDCNDNDSGINPAASEVCKNNIDDNCNGVVDDKTTCEQCKNASDLTTTNITSTSAQFNWSSVTNPEQWSVQYKTTKPGSKYVDAPLLAGNARSVIISSLIADQNYNWQISAKCKGSWTVYSANVNFKTLASGATGNKLTNSTIKGTKATTLNTSTLSLYPNPNRGQFILDLRVVDKINATAMIQLIDMTGKTVQTQNAEIYRGTLQRTIKLSSALPNGIYLVRIIVNGEVYKTNLVYEK